MGKKGLKGLVIVTGFGPVAKDLADVAVGPILALSAVVDGVWRRVGHLHLCGTVLGVMEVEAVADVTEKSWRKLLLCGLIIVVIIVIQLTWIISIQSSSSHCLQVCLLFLILLLEVNDD